MFNFFPIFENTNLDNSAKFCDYCREKAPDELEKIGPNINRISVDLVFLTFP